MKKPLFLAIAALGLLLVSHTASAQATPVSNTRQRTEQRRIRQGMRSGELTRPEAARRLQGRAAEVHQDKRQKPCQAMHQAPS